MVGARGALWRRRHWKGSGAENFDLLNILAQLTHTTVKIIYIHIPILHRGQWEHREGRNFSHEKI